MFDSNPMNKLRSVFQTPPPVTPDTTKDTSNVSTDVKKNQDADSTQNNKLNSDTAKQQSQDRNIPKNDLKNQKPKNTDPSVKPTDAEQDSFSISNYFTKLAQEKVMSQTASSQSSEEKKTDANPDAVSTPKNKKNSTMSAPTPESNLAQPLMPNAKLYTKNPAPTPKRAMTSIPKMKMPRIRKF